MADNFNLKKYLAEGKLLKETTFRKEKDQFKKAKEVLSSFNKDIINMDQVVPRVIKILGFKPDKYNEMEVGDYLYSQVLKGKIRVEDDIIENILDILTYDK